MTERVFATGSVKERIEAELKACRANHDQYVRANHPQVFFVALNTLMHEQRYATLISQSLFQEACSLLTQKLSIYENCTPFDPARVWVGIQA